MPLRRLDGLPVPSRNRNGRPGWGGRSAVVFSSWGSADCNGLALNLGKRVLDSLRGHSKIGCNRPLTVSPHTQAENVGLTVGQFQLCHKGVVLHHGLPVGGVVTTTPGQSSRGTGQAVGVIVVPGIAAKVGILAKSAVDGIKPVGRSVRPDRYSRSGGQSGRRRSCGRPDEQPGKPLGRGLFHRPDTPRCPFPGYRLSGQGGGR